MHTFACEFAPSVRVRMCMRMLVPVTPRSSPLVLLSLAPDLYVFLFSPQYSAEVFSGASSYEPCGLLLAGAPPGAPSSAPGLRGCA